jgi:hypothetical protein
MARSNVKIDFDGLKFDSTTELEFYKKLKDFKSRGKIWDFQCSPKYTLQEGNWHNWRGDKQDSIDHYPDYLVTDNDGNSFIVDSKGSSYHETDAKLKKKIWEYQNRELPYYYASKCPKYLGGEWVDTSVSHDMLKKLNLIYNKLYPNQNKRLKDTPIFSKNEWGKYMEFHSVCGLFYTYDKIYTKKELDKVSKQKSK